MVILGFAQDAEGELHALGNRNALPYSLGGANFGVVVKILAANRGDDDDDDDHDDDDH